MSFRITRHEDSNEVPNVQATLERRAPEVLPWISDRAVENQLRRVLVETIGASSRCLVWGPRGIGKTDTLRRLLREELRDLSHPRPIPRIVHVPLIGVQRERDAYVSIAKYVPLDALAERARRHRLSVDSVRAELISGLRQQGRNVLVIDEAHQLSPGARKAVLDLLVEADHATNGGAEPRWLGLILIASSPHHKALLSEFDCSERIQSVIELAADSRTEIANILREWLPELGRHEAFSDSPAALEHWIGLRFGEGVPSLRAVADLVQRYRAREAQRGDQASMAGLNLKMLNSQAQALLGNQQRAMQPALPVSAPTNAPGRRRSEKQS